MKDGETVLEAAYRSLGALLAVEAQGEALEFLGERRERTRREAIVGCKVHHVGDDDLRGGPEFLYADDVNDELSRGGGSRLLHGVVPPAVSSRLEELTLDSTVRRLRSHVVFLITADRQVFATGSGPGSEAKAFQMTESKGQGYLSTISQLISRIGCDEAGDLDGLNPSASEDAGDGTRALYYLICSPGMQQRITDAGTVGVFLPMGTLDVRMPRALRQALQFKVETDSVKVGDVVAYRVGTMEDGEFGIGKITEEPTNGNNTVTIHVHGLQSTRRKTQRNMLRGRYLPRYITKDGLAASCAPEMRDQPTDEIRVSLLDVVASPFTLEDGYLPEGIRRGLANSVLRKLALFRDRLHRSHVARRALMAFGQHLVLDTAKRVAGGQHVVEIRAPRTLWELRRALAVAKHKTNCDARDDKPQNVGKSSV